MPQNQSCCRSLAIVEQRASFAALPSFSFELMEPRTAFVDTRTAAGLRSPTQHAKTTRHALTQSDRQLRAAAFSRSALQFGRIEQFFTT
jgi:hypothetical protein